MACSHARFCLSAEENSKQRNESPAPNRPPAKRLSRRRPSARGENQSQNHQEIKLLPAKVKIAAAISCAIAYPAKEMAAPSAVASAAGPPKPSAGVAEGMLGRTACRKRRQAKAQSWRNNN